MSWPMAPMQPALTITGSPPSGSAGDPTRDVNYTLDRAEAWEIGLIPGQRYLCFHEGPLATQVAATLELATWNAGTKESTGTVLAGTTPEVWSQPPTGTYGLEIRDTVTGRTYRASMTAGLEVDAAVTVTLATDLLDAVPRTVDVRLCWWVPSNVQIRWHDGQIQILFDDEDQANPGSFFQHYLDGYIDLVPDGYDLWDGTQQWCTFALGAQIAGVYTGVLSTAEGWHLNVLFGGNEDFASAYDTGVHGGEAVTRPYPRASMDPRIWSQFATDDPGTPYPPRESGARSSGGYVPGLIGSSGTHALAPRPEVGRDLTTPRGWVYP